MSVDRRILLIRHVLPTTQVFVSDGAKCDIARLQLMFGQDVVTAAQDPSYPVYVDTAVIMGQTGTIDEVGRRVCGPVCAWL